MQQIHRHDIVFNAFREPVCISFRKGFTVLSLVFRGGIPSIYVTGDPKAPSDDRFVRLLTTGDEVPEGAEYVGTLALSDHDKSLLAHAFFVPAPVPVVVMAK
jgi:hypothetical protein